MKTNLLRLYPGSKLIILFSLCLSALIVNNILFYLLILLLFLGLASAASIFKEYSKTLFKTLAVLGLFMFLMISITTKGTDLITSFFVFDVYQEGIDRACLLIARISVLCGGFLLFFKITSSAELSFILTNLGFGPVGVFVVKSAIQMVPEMKKQMNVIIEAQKSRGMDFSGNAFTRFRKMIPTMLPLILSSFYSTEEKSLVLEARGISIPGKKARLYQPLKTKKDIVIYSLMLLYLLIILVWRLCYA
ncbi:hypothetical protein ATZ33_11720 [Enterococcus silesiacus]|uniref:Cobalt transporter n=1 Tax=Enterococcus silesiacus TaxID=332949 RepID=A0ABN4JB16_9ENTE|nr:energy-coupling factor transporter transmembrane component T [Enterococcus silesiacus]ALS02027.1 hypothetical protein ATZ33_11720 [Enterococcus silesiacus]